MAEIDVSKSDAMAVDSGTEDDASIASHDDDPAGEDENSATPHAVQSSIKVVLCSWLIDGSMDQVYFEEVWETNAFDAITVGDLLENRKLSKNMIHGTLAGLMYEISMSELPIHPVEAEDRAEEADGPLDRLDVRVHRARALLDGRPWIPRWEVRTVEEHRDVPRRGGGR